MTNIVESFKKIQLNIDKINTDKIVNIIAVSKTFPLEHIQPLIEYGHLHFGENKVQEAVSKWTSLKKVNENIKKLLTEIDISSTKLSELIGEYALINKVNVSNLDAGCNSSTFAFC